MNLLTTLRFCVLMFGMLGIQSIAMCSSIDMLLDNAVSEMQHKLVGNGQVVAVVGVGQNRPENENLFFISYSDKEQIDIDRVMQARWLSSTEIIVQHSYDTISKSLGNRIIRINRRGQLLEVLSDQEGLTSPITSDSGKWAALKMDQKSGVLRGIELHKLRKESALPSFIPFEQNPKLNNLSHVVWGPSSNQIVLAAWVKSDRGYIPRIGLVTDTVSGIKTIDNEKALNAKPLFWSKERLYASGNDGLLRCNIVKNNCELVYAPGADKYIFSGVAMDNGNVLLLVQDRKRDPFETRAKEVHKLNLLEGKSEAILYLPEDIFIIDIDWTSN